MNGRLVRFAVKLWIIRLVLFEDVVDGSQQHPCNGNNRFLVSAPLFKIEITGTDFRSFFTLDGSKSTLHEQRLDVSASPADSGCFLLSGALVVLRRKTGPGAKMLGGRNTDISTPISEMMPIAA